MPSPSPITDEHFRRLHPIAIEAHDRILSLLDQLRRERCILRRAINRRIDPETAILERIDGDVLVLDTQDFEPDDRAYVFLNFELQGVPYFFSARRIDDKNSQRLRVCVPSAVYRAERRDRTRSPSDSARRGSRRLLVETESTGSIEAEIEDSSPAGLAIRLRDNSAQLLEDCFPIRFMDGDRAGSQAHARVRHRSQLAGRPGWTRIGLDLSLRTLHTPVKIERRATILGEGSWQSTRLGWEIMLQGARLASRRASRALARRSEDSPKINVVRYANEQGEPIVAIADSWGDTRGAPAVVIPPAWGRTKETLLALAETVVATFRAARRPVTVIRFDGIRRRGESYNDPECGERGKDHYHFTFHQGVDDVVATLDFLERSREFQPSTSILVTFSAASIEGRRVAMLEGGKRVGGWVCVVGTADIQSMMRVISGGVDYAAGFERGVRFGLQELLGVVVDIDHAGFDAIEKKLTFLEDSRRDFAEIDIPITWYHGEHDAWMSLGRVRDVLAHGDSSKRQLIQVPTGHQLKTSRQALELFQDIAVEIGRMATGETLRPALPDLAALEAKHRAERKRRPAPFVDIRRFWQDYLVGRDGALGIELMTDKSAYRDLIATEIEKLCLRPGDRVADLGSGTGPFPLAVVSLVEAPSPLEIHEVDYVREALMRARQRLGHGHRHEGFVVRFVEADLDLGDRGCFIPLRSGSYDAVLASLVLSYVGDPGLLLREIRRLLRPGGRLVVSSMRCDADISKVWADGLAEHREAVSRGEIGEKDPLEMEVAGRVFLNDAARLLDLEESGVFRFWEVDDLVRLLRRAGFRKIESCVAFGDPPQALVLAAESP